MRRREFILSVGSGLLVPKSFAGRRRDIVASKPTAAAAAGCSTTQEDIAGDNSGLVELGRFGIVGVAFKFTSDATYTTCKCNVTMRKVGTPTSNITASIYSHNAGSDLPDSLVGTASDARAASGFNASYQDEAFVNMSASQTNTTVYWAVFISDSSNNSNYVEIGSQNGGPAVRMALDDGMGFTFFADRAPDLTLFSS